LWSAEKEAQAYLLLKYSLAYIEL